MTRLELSSFVRFDPVFSSTTVFTDANLQILLNQAAQIMALDGWALPISGTWSGVASAQRYILSGGGSPKVTNFGKIFQEGGGLVYTPSSGVTRTSPNDFEWTSEEQLDLQFPGWQDDSASDTLEKVFIGYDSSGYLNLGVHPKTSSTTPSFELNFLSVGTDMSSDGNYPWVNESNPLVHLEPFTIGLAYWTQSKLHELITHNQSESNRYLELYVVEATKMREAQRRIILNETMGRRRVAQLPASESFGGL